MASYNYESSIQTTHLNYDVISVKNKKSEKPEKLRKISSLAIRNLKEKNKIHASNHSTTSGSTACSSSSLARSSLSSHQESHVITRFHLNWPLIWPLTSKQSIATFKYNNKQFKQSESKFKQIFSLGSNIGQFNRRESKWTN